MTATAAVALKVMRNNLSRYIWRGNAKSKFKNFIQKFLKLLGLITQARNLRGWDSWIPKKMK